MSNQLQTNEGRLGAGMPGLRGTDHIGLTVPDIAQAEAFFVDVIGCEPFYELGPAKRDDDWMAVHLGVDARAEIRKIKFLRCGFGANLELFEYKVANQPSRGPRNSDIGGHHLALYVDDMTAAVAHLRRHNVTVQGEPTTRTEGPGGGQTWVYFLAPWGLQMELVSYPSGKNYTKDTDRRMWHSAFPAE